MGADAGRTDRFELIYRAHAADVLAYCLRRAESAAADDALAETFLVAWRRLDELSGDPLPWLLAVARRVVANQRRSARRRVALHERVVEEHVPRVDAFPSPAPILEALDRLPEADREVLLLQAWEGLSSAEASIVVGCSPVAFRIRAYRARRRLEAALRGLTGDEPVMSASAIQPCFDPEGGRSA
jgi:RNA polymerase sigma-70 factor, ECF subfamily